MAKDSKTEDVVFFNAQDGVRGRNGGPYGDVVDAERAEINRAFGEGREPDLENPPPTVGQVLIPSHQVQDNIWSNPSMAAGPNLLAEGLADARKKALEESDRDAEVGFAPVTLAVDTRTELPDSERKASEKESAELNKNPANVATTSTAQVGQK